MKRLSTRLEIAGRRPALVEQAERWYDATFRRHPKLAMVFLALLIIAWSYPYIKSGGLIQAKPDDADYFFQAYEAIRQTIVVHHQFPWWNAWVGGGVPLFANPQIGVISIQTVMVVIFGTVLGLKLAVVVYTLAGYAGALLLFRRQCGTSLLVASLLAFCWIGNGFFVAHLMQHFSFVYFMLLPLGLYLQLSITRQRYWLYYGLWIGLVVLAAFHYALLQMIAILAGVAVWQWFRAERRRQLVVKLAAAAAVGAVLSCIRVAYTVQYVLEFSKHYKEQPNAISLLLAGLLTPGVNANFVNGALLNHQVYLPHEYSAYMGLILFVALLFVAVLMLLSVFGKLRGPRPLLAVLFGLFLLAFVMAIGDFGYYSPYALSQHLPGYANMRVPSRWLLWCGFVSLCIVALASVWLRGRQRAALVMLLLFGTLELYIFGFGYMRHAFVRQAVQFRSPTAQFVAFENYYPGITSTAELNHQGKTPVVRANINYEYEATLNNVGELYGYEPIYLSLYDTKGRCGINLGCQLVSSGNAQVTAWSPNKLELRRTGAGDIVLNMAPSNYWLVNNQRLTPMLNVTGPGKLTISTAAPTITLQAVPKSPLEMLND